ncbi:MAG: S8 family serine peptidase [Clostridiales bacterium]|nr:S8 family serine peptidase [Clostridiales bacterium]
MDSQKIENPLNLALDVSATERERSVDLNFGFDDETNLWELIVRFNTGLERAASEIGFSYVELLANYAIIRIEQSKIERLASYTEIEFIEKPRRLSFEVAEARIISCVPAVEAAPNFLTGKGVIVAIIDSGIDYAHPDFRNEDGTTRILELWDQSLIPPDDTLGPPPGYIEGTLFTQERINQALRQTSMQQRMAIVPSIDGTGHGTHVAGIAAGNGRASNGRNRGVATQSDLLVVKLGRSANDSFPSTTQLMTGVDYVIKKALELRRPVAVNLSFGNNYGSHDGRTIVEDFINDAANVWKNNIIVGTGNEGASRTHTSGVLEERVSQVIELAVGDGVPGLNLQIWKNYFDNFEISIIHPSGNRVGPIQQILGSQQFNMNQTRVLLYYGEPQPVNRAQEIYIDFIPQGEYLTPGIWKFELTPRDIIVGNYDFWLPSVASLGTQTGFLRPVPETTLTIPSTARNVISVGAYDSTTDSYASFSGRGYTRDERLIKPDLVAPGVNILAASPGGGYSVRTGTSMATPFVTGAAALLMQWGIVENNDPYLYGEKMKAYLIKGTRRLPGFQIYPNPSVGWGALCVRDSLPI